MSRGLKALLGILIIAIPASVLFFFNPKEAIWMPKCPLYLLTHLQCPSCGSTRAAYSFLHLHFHDAFLYNPFLVLSIPYAIILVAVTFFDPNGRLSGLKRIFCSNTAIYIYLSLYILWGILRNIPPFNGLLLQ